MVHFKTVLRAMVCQEQICWGRTKGTSQSNFASGGAVMNHSMESWKHLLSGLKWELPTVVREERQEI